MQLQLREVENAALITGQQLSTTKEEKQKLEAAHSQLTLEHHETSSRLTSETEEKERAQQEMHQLRKQVFFNKRISAFGRTDKKLFCR
jgi:3-deoxy-D-manno-octulosonic-acid transferase